ncbi:uncharacterized protein LOC106650451 [Trichogramma pretiosum]|uniref:uncharacterized protein LOC106650451 n=1 Tax=Trichogramma pretiosum TaxID=7493 RepID=UPI0006C99A17|nr:uncharacterized protein LOC106650451 [Trichogramma pretiosum]
MLQLFLLSFCIYNALGNPIKTFEVMHDEANEAEIIEAVPRLPGTVNLFEKRIPVLRLFVPYERENGPTGSKNLHEQTQIPHYYGPPSHGIRNFEEKAIPNAVIARLNAEGFKHYSDEIDHIYA